MTYLISRANYERCTAWMTAAERAAFDREYTIYPDRQSPDGQIDVTRLADRFLTLQSAEPPAYRTPGTYWSWMGGRGFGKAARIWHAQDEADKFPPDFDMIDPDRASWYGGPSWLPAETLVEDITYDTGVTARRYHLNQWKTAEDLTAKDLIAAMRRWTDHAGERNRPPRTRIAAGKVAYQAFALLAQPRRGWPKDFAAGAATLAHLADTPIVADPELADAEWKLIDTDNDLVLHAEELTGPLADQARAACTRLAEMTTAAKDATDDLADRAGVPRHLLY